MRAGCARCCHERILRRWAATQVSLAGVRARLRHRRAQPRAWRSKLAQERQAGQRAGAWRCRHDCRDRSAWLLGGGHRGRRQRRRVARHCEAFRDQRDVLLRSVADRRGRRRRRANASVLGGMVEKGSVEKTAGTPRRASFLVTDFKHTVPVKYSRHPARPVSRGAGRGRPRSHAGRHVRRR